MTTIDQLNRAADLIRDDKGADRLTRVVGDWLRAEALTQEAMPHLVDVFNVGIRTAGGPEAYLRIGLQEDGEPAMQSSTNDHALAVAAEIVRRYES